MVRSSASSIVWSGWKIRDQTTCQSTAAITLLPLDREPAHAPLAEDRGHRTRRVELRDRLPHRLSERVVLACGDPVGGGLDPARCDLELATGLLHVEADRRIVGEVRVDLA